MRDSVEVADIEDEGRDGVAISYDDTDVELSELGPRGGRVTSTAGLMPGLLVVARMLRFDSDDDDAHRRFSCVSGGATGRGGDAEDPDDERGRSRSTSTLSGRRDARREIWPDAIEPRRPRRGGRVKSDSDGRAAAAGRAVVGVVDERVDRRFGRWW